MTTQSLGKQADESLSRLRRVLKEGAYVSIVCRATLVVLADRGDAEYADLTFEAIEDELLQLPTLDANCSADGMGFLSWGFPSKNDQTSCLLDTLISVIQRSLESGWQNIKSAPTASSDLVNRYVLLLKGMQSAARNAKGDGDWIGVGQKGAQLAHTSILFIEHLYNVRAILTPPPEEREPDKEEPSAMMTPVEPNRVTQQNTPLVNADEGIRKIQERVLKAKKRLEIDVLEIEKRTDLTVEQKANQIIHIFSAGCAAVAVQPLPFADMFALTAIQIYMGSRLAAIHGVPVNTATITEMITDLAKACGLGLLAQQLAIGAYKTVLPLLGGFTTIPLVYGLTYAIGKVMNAHFFARAKGQRMSEAQKKALWKQMRSEGTKTGKKESATIKAQVLDSSL